MPRGGKRAGAGRPKGSRNVATKEQIADLAALARQAAPGALETLIKVSKNPEETGSARVAAANAILDRAYGRPQQSVDHTSTDGSAGFPTVIQMIGVGPDDDKGDG